MSREYIISYHVSRWGNIEPAACFGVRSEGIRYSSWFWFLWNCSVDITKFYFEKWGKQNFVLWGIMTTVPETIVLQGSHISMNVVPVSFWITPKRTFKNGFGQLQVVDVDVLITEDYFNVVEKLRLLTLFLIAGVHIQHRCQRTEHLTWSER